MKNEEFSWSGDNGGSRSQPGGVSRGPKGRVRRVREGCPLPFDGGAGGLPRENFEKMVLL